MKQMQEEYKLLDTNYNQLSKEHKEQQVASWQKIHVLTSDSNLQYVDRLFAR